MNALISLICSLGLAASSCNVSVANNNQAQTGLELRDVLSEEFTNAAQGNKVKREVVNTEEEVTVGDTFVQNKKNEDGSYSMRVISGISSVDVAKAQYSIKIGERTQEVPVTRAYKAAMVAGGEKSAIELFGKEYLIAFVINNIPYEYLNNSYVVVPTLYKTLTGSGVSGEVKEFNLESFVIMDNVDVEVSKENDSSLLFKIDWKDGNYNLEGIFNKGTVAANIKSNNSQVDIKDISTVEVENQASNSAYLKIDLDNQISESTYSFDIELATKGYKGTVALRFDSEFNGESFDPVTNFKPSKVLKDYQEVTFDLDGGACDLEGTLSYRIGKTYDDLPTPTKEGYNFAGWINSELLSYTSSWANLSDVVVEDGKEVNNSKTITLRALWNDPNFVYEKLSDNTYAITSYTGNESIVTIPTFYNGKAVTVIGNGSTSVFSSNVTNVNIPNSVTSIGESAFRGCSGLTNITIPSSVITIGKSAFSGCSCLTKVNYTGTIDEWVQIEFGSGDSNPTGFAKDLYINNKLVIEANIQNASKINNYAFYNCISLTSIIIGDGVTSIGGSAFSVCSSLTSVTIGDSVTSIGEYAFERCSSLASVTIPDSVTTIYGSAFYNCSNLTSVTIGNGVTNIGNFAFLECSSLTSVTIPNSVTSIGNYAFSGCSSLTSVTIPNSVTSIGSYAFSVCNSLTSVIIGDCVTSIGSYAFYGCSRLQSITIPEGVTSIGPSAFEGCSSLASVTIPDSVTSIGSSAFYNCSSLTSITIPNSVTSIGSYAFYGCSRLQSITIPEGVTSISAYAFSGCSSITSVIIGDCVTSIGYNAFEYCSSLTSITIPDSVTIIYGSAFYNCSSLTSITIPNSVTRIGEYAFERCSSLASVTIPDSVTTIYGSAFYNCSSLTSITIPEGVTRIGPSAFSGCSSLTSITLPFVGNTLNGTTNTHFGYIFGASSYTNNNSYVPSSLKNVTITGGKSIGEYAFSSCSNLTSVTIGDSVTSIGEYAFYNCSSLTSVTIGNSVTSIGKNIFQNCTNLQFNQYDGAFYLGNDNNPYIILCKTQTTISSCIINENCKFISNNAFSSCSSLTSITIPNSVTSIGDEAFEWCQSLTSITIGNSVISIGEKAFEVCSSLTNVTIPNSVTSIGYSAFGSCNSLESITLPFVGKTLNGTTNTSIGYIFGSVPSSLKNVTITGETIGDNAFYNCRSLTTVTIGDSVTSIGNNAFEDCNSLTKVNYLGTIDEWVKIEFYNQYSNPLCYAHNLYINNELVTKLNIQNVSEINNYAFYKCSSLTSVTIGNSVTSIGESAFLGCNSLTKVNYLGTINEWTQIEFTGEYSNPLCHAHNLYINNELVTKLNIQNVSKINNYSFYGCSGLTNVTIGDSVTSIGYRAFLGCNSLRSVTLPFVGNTLNDTTNTHFGYIFGASSYSDNNSYVPSSLKNVTITGGTSIGSYAFYNCSSLTSVKIENSVTSIGGNAFYGCSSLESITLPFVGNTLNGTENTHFGYIFGASSYSDNETRVPKSLKNVTITGGTIDSYAFYRCIKLTSVTITDSVTSIGEYAFYGCSSLTSITIPNSVTSIGSHAFRNCSSLTSVTIPDSVTSIGQYAFSGCRNLTSVTFEEGSKLTTIGSSAFSYCSGLTNIEIPNNVTSIDYFAFGSCSGLTSVTIGDSVESICERAFEGCNNLTSITIPDSVTSIGDSAFKGCSGLTNITIPNSVTSIGYSAFGSCNSLESITLPFVGNRFNGTTNTNFGYIFGTSNYNYNKSSVPASLKNVTITGGTIGSYAFYDCSSLTTVTIGDSVTSIGSSAFYYCSSLTKVNYLGTINEWTQIEFAGGSSNPLYYAQNLYISGQLVTEANIQNVSKINSFAFCNCSLTSVTIGNSVTSIGNNAFEDCNSLTKVNYLGTIDEWVKIEFYNQYSNPLYCAHNLYINNELVKEANIQNVSKINSFAFYNCTSLTSATIGGSVTSISRNAFYNCSSLTSVTIGNSVTSISERAFRYCSSLESITLPFVGNTLNGTTNTHFGYIFGEYSYSDYSYNKSSVPTSLKNVTITGGKIINYAFFECSSLTSVTIGDGVTSIGMNAFQNCSSLTSVTIGNGVTSIGGSAFNGCSSLTSITFLGTEEEWNAISKVYNAIPSTVTITFKPETQA